VQGPFLLKGSEVHLLSLSVWLGDDGTPTGHAQIGTVLDIWPMWLDVAIEHAEAAQEGRDELGALLAGGRDEADPQTVGDLMTRECQASLVAIAASAFALENFYSGAVERMPGADQLRAQERNTPARVREVLRRLIRPTNERAKMLRTLITSIYRLRDNAVHPSAKLRLAPIHDLLGLPVEWRLAQYTARTANTVVYSSAAVIKEACHQTQADPVLGNWCQARQERIGERFERASSLEPRS
jgi:hypothetical protein